MIRHNYADLCSSDEEMAQMLYIQSCRTAWFLLKDSFATRDKFRYVRSIHVNCSHFCMDRDFCAVEGAAERIGYVF